MRKLTVLLVLSTLLPNLTLGAFWLGIIDLPWSKPPAISASGAPMPAVEPAPPLSAPALPVLSAPDALEAPAGGVVFLPIALDGTDGIPAGSSVIIKGLPPGAVLSSGYASSSREWSLSPGNIGDLQLAIPETASGPAALTIQLVAPGYRVVADASTLLKVLLPAPVEQRLADLAEMERLGQAPQHPDAVEENMTAAIESASIDLDAPPLPDRRPEPSASDAASASYVRPSAYVNLRQAPSSSASVVGVVAKGAKLRVISRKRGWVQISNPTTAQTGWIYAGNVATAQ
jgi:hypothetical protein